MAELLSAIFTKQRDIEKLFAATVFISPEYAIQTCGWVMPDMLSDVRVRKFWTAVRAGETQYQASMDADIQFEIIDWMKDIQSYFAMTDYANEIARYNYLIGMGIKAQELATAVSRMSSEEAAAIAEQISATRLGSQEVLPQVGEIALRFITAVTSDSRTIKTGIAKLDENTGGLERQTLSVLAARPSMGKTALALNIARAAADAGNKVLFLSLEMSAVSIWARMACGDTETTWQDVKAHKLTQEQEARLLQTSDRLSSEYAGRLVVDDRLPRSTADVWRITAQQHFDLVIADHLRIFSDPHERETKRLGLITERLKAAAKANDCHIMVLSQMNREVEGKTDKRPTLADLRDSGEIEENADQVFMMYRDDYYNPVSNPGDTSATELWIRKNRDGVKDPKIILVYHLKKQKFYAAVEHRINLNDFTV